MYYKKQGDTPPMIMSGSVYNESYTIDGCLYLKYYQNNTPSETLEEITQEEYEANKPTMEEEVLTLAEPTEEEILQAEMLLNQQKMINRQNEQDVVLAELLLNQQGV